MLSGIRTQPCAMKNLKLKLSTSLSIFLLPPQQTRHLCSIPNTHLPTTVEPICHPASFWIPNKPNLPPFYHCRQ